jgi:ankyrin repeat protein
MLISAGADVDAKARQLDGSNKTALITAAENTCCKQPLKILLDHGADPAQRLAAATQNVTPLHKAAALASAAHCRALLAARSQRLVHLKDSSYSTPDLMAAKSGCSETVEVLHKAGAALNTADQHCNTPLHLAITSAAAVGHLLRHKAAVNAADKLGCTPLFNAAYKGNVAAVKLLLQHGASAHIKNNHGLGPADIAVEDGHVDMLELLVAHDVGINAVGKSGTTLLITAASKQQVAVAERLLEHGARLNTADTNGLTALLHVARKHGNAAMTEVLLAHGADVKQCNVRHHQW